MLIAFYVSGHGFGHASRDIELIRTLRELRPDARIVLRTSVPRWLFEEGLGAEVDVQLVETDTGMAQIDSLRIDVPETVRQVTAFHAGFNLRVDEQARVLESLGATVVIGDIPPLAFAAAARAGLPSVAVGNFTWDWIYGIYSEIARAAPDAIPVMREAYARTSLALRLPMHGGFEPMANVTRDIPFIARRSARDPRETRRRLGVPDDRPLVLTSFGGHSLQLPFDVVERDGRLTILRGSATGPPGLGLAYEDLVAAADVVVSKPGYGIVSECVANGTPLLYTSRGRFIEYDLFVAEMPAVLQCRYLSQEDLLAGRWADAVDALLAQDAPRERPRIDGAEIAAAAIADLVS